MQIIENLSNQSWTAPIDSASQSIAITALEEGKVLFFPKLSFQLTPEEQRFLLPEFVSPRTKNISFDTRSQCLRGAQGTPAELQKIHALLLRFSQHAIMLVQNLFPSYMYALEPARASLRTVEISQRQSSERKDDKRLHVDAFPATPNQGRRILRVFSNINPHGKSRVWRLGEPFINVAQRFLPGIKKPLPYSSEILKLLKITKTQRTEYDHIMLQIHDKMKYDAMYQKNAQQIEFHFPPGTSWIVQTDHVSHAAMSGQHVLEQTFYLPVQAMMDANRSPLKILEQLTGRTLA